MNSPLVNNQRGGVMVFVIIVGLVMTTAFILFMNSTVLVEGQAVEGSLAKARAYWAQMGNYNYMLSRTGYSYLCNGCASSNNLDTAYVPVMQAYFNELSNLQTWTYPDESSSYTITIPAPTAAVDPDPSRGNHSGWLMASATASSSSLVSGLNGYLPQMELRLCVGLASSTSKCGTISGNNGGGKSGYFSISRLTNVGS